jgi:hypothetical protein
LTTMLDITNFWATSFCLYRLVGTYFIQIKLIYLR